MGEWKRKEKGGSGGGRCTYPAHADPAAAEEQERNKITKNNAEISWQGRELRGEKGANRNEEGEETERERRGGREVGGGKGGGGGDGGKEEGTYPAHADPAAAEEVDVLLLDEELHHGGAEAGVREHADLLGDVAEIQRLVHSQECDASR
jgi:hypothetical protein